MRAVVVSFALLLTLLTGSLGEGQLSEDLAPTLEPVADYPFDCAVQFVHGIGLACDRGDLWEAFQADGTSLGFLHKEGDAIPHDHVHEELEAGSDVAAASTLARPVACVDGAPGTYYAVVIYARAHDDADQYASRAAEIRSMVEQSNQKVYASAIASGGKAADLKVLCSNGVIDVRNEVLPTNRASANFNSISGDLRAKGYTDPKVKHWVFYDDNPTGYGGQGNIYPDDRPGVENYNNGNSYAMFAITYGYTGSSGVRIMLHELGHNLGAVQNSAPHSTGGYHCWDGTDIMCYNDGGPNGHKMTYSLCSSQVWDCGLDDYFNTAPAPGSYLATRWNIGSPVNRYIRTSGLVSNLVDCGDRATVGASYACGAIVDTADGSGVALTIDWGDGAVESLPATGFAPSGSTLRSSHAYASAGTYTVRVTATDDATPPNTVTATRTVEARTYWLPEVASFTCPSLVLRGKTESCSVKVTDSDGDGVAATLDWGDKTATRVPSKGYVASGSTSSASHAWSAVGDYTVAVTPEDSAGRKGATATRVVQVRDNTPPTLDAMSCAIVPYWNSKVRCVLKVSDGESDVRALVHWGDGTANYSPYVASGSTVTLEHQYARGSYTVTARAEDRHATQSAPRTQAIDATPPSLYLNAPRHGNVYTGCRSLTESDFVVTDMPAAATDLEVRPIDLPLPPWEPQPEPIIIELDRDPYLVAQGCLSVSMWDAGGIASLTMWAYGGCDDDWGYVQVANPSSMYTHTFPICRFGTTWLYAEVLDRAGNYAYVQQRVHLVPNDCVVREAVEDALPVVGRILEVVYDAVRDLIVITMPATDSAAWTVQVSCPSDIGPAPIPPIGRPLPWPPVTLPPIEPIWIELPDRYRTDLG